MIHLRRPEPYAIRGFLDNQLTDSLTYAEVGATNGDLPDDIRARGYSVNHTRELLGRGHSAFESACGALKSWQQLQLGWVDCWPHNAPLRAEENIAVLGRAFGLWWLNACRVIYTVDERAPNARFGYAYGTLPSHLACGEERFLVEMTPDEDVWIDILAFSRPNTTLAKIGYPIMRRAQKRFGRESATRMRLIVESAVSARPSDLKPSQQRTPNLA